jgi:LPXTG-motif cell wall-anchored protein
MIRRILVAAAAAILATGVVAAPVSANRNEVRVDCDGLHFSMERGEVGTDVTVTAGERRWTFEIARQNDPLVFTLASPNPAAAVTWAVLVDSPWHEGETWRTYTWPACAPATTIPAPTTTTTTPPTVTTTTAPPASSTSTTAPTAATTTSVPNTAPTTVITTPRPTTTAVPPATPSTSVPTTWRLPDTGRSDTTGPAAAIGAAAIAAGLLLVTAAARRRSTR